MRRITEPYREATRAFTLTVGRLNAAKYTPDFPAALGHCTEARQVMDETRSAFKQHRAEKHGPA